MIHDEELLTNNLGYSNMAIKLLTVPLFMGKGRICIQAQLSGIPSIYLSASSIKRLGV